MTSNIPKKGYTAQGIKTKIYKPKQEEYSSEFGVNNQIYFCGVPFRLDSYSGCTFMCKYCFSRTSELTNISNKNRQSNILVPDPKNFKRYLAIALDQGLKRADINIEWLRHKVPIHWGGMSDPFQPCEAKYKITKAWLEYLNWYQYPVVISTKSTMLVEPEYLQLLKEGNYAVQITLITDDDNIVKQLEPNAPSATERLNAISKLVEAGIWVAVIIQPMIPNSPIENKLPEYITKLAKLGVNHVLIEAYKVQVRNSIDMNYIWQLFPEATKAYNFNDTQSFGFELLLPSWRKYQYVKVAKTVCKENNITFGAADNDMRDFGDVVCCCGIDNLKGFENFWKYQASQAAKIAKEQGTVSLGDMQQFWSGDKGSIAEQAGEMRNTAKAHKANITAKYAIDFMWNKGNECSPAVMPSMNIDSDNNGNIIYKYKDPTNKLENNYTEQFTLF